MMATLEFEFLQLKRLENQPLNSPTTGEADVLFAVEGVEIGEESAIGEPNRASVDIFWFKAGISNGGAAINQQEAYLKSKGNLRRPFFSFSFFALDETVEGGTTFLTSFPTSRLITPKPAPTL